MVVLVVLDLKEMATFVDVLLAGKGCQVFAGFAVFVAMLDMATAIASAGAVAETW